MAWHKYHARKTECLQGHMHASKREAKRCNDLHILQAVGRITNLEVEPQYWFKIDGQQVKHLNGRRVGYKPDFRYREDDQLVCEDVKGMMTPDATLRIAIFRHLFPEVDLRVVK